MSSSTARPACCSGSLDYIAADAARRCTIRFEPHEPLEHQRIALGSVWMYVLELGIRNWNRIR
jgi:hypothetical protein